MQKFPPTSSKPLGVGGRIILAGQVNNYIVRSSRDVIVVAYGPNCPTPSV